MTPLLLTGATDGIGRALVPLLRATGRPLVLHGRSQEKLAALGAETECADLASLEQVRSMVERLRRFPSLIVINNAGVATVGPGAHRSQTRDGFELAWGVNFLAAFALTEGLAAAGVRLEAVVNVASAGQSPVDVKDPNLERSWDAWEAYRRSKLAMVAWTFERARRAPETPITALHPGTFLRTKMVLEGGIAPMGVPESGAEAIDFVLQRTLAGTTGRYFDVKREARALPQAADETFQRWLFAYATQATGVGPAR